MTKKTIATGVVHSVPADLRLALQASSATLEKWNNLTPLARNEWICWVTFVNQTKTRQEHIERLIKEVKGGKRRPCCWIGCIHRKDKAISPSIQAVLEKRLGRTK